MGFGDTTVPPPSNQRFFFSLGFKYSPEEYYLSSCDDQKSPTCMGGEGTDLEKSKTLTS